jgi:hypothetical protein
MKRLIYNAFFSSEAQQKKTRDAHFWKSEIKNKNDGINTSPLKPTQFWVVMVLTPRRTIKMANRAKGNAPKNTIERVTKNTTLLSFAILILVSLLSVVLSQLYQGSGVLSSGIFITYFMDKISAFFYL